MRIFSGNANRELAKRICAYLDMELGDITVGRFSDGEINVEIEENVRGEDVFLIQPTSPPCNRNLMELLIMIDAMKRSSASRITAVVPYYGYSRQDRKDRPRVPITAKLVANLITVAGADRVLSIDMHSGQIQGFFDIPVDNLYSTPVITQRFTQLGLDDITIVSPDAGSAKRARAIAERMGAGLAIIDKRREKANVAKAMEIIGQVKGRNCLIMDDIIDTAGSFVEACNALKKGGAKTIYGGVTHPILSGPARERLQNAPLEKLFVTNTIPVDNAQNIENLEVIDIAELLGEAILRIHANRSVSSLFI